MHLLTRLCFLKTAESLILWTGWIWKATSLLRMEGFHGWGRLTGNHSQGRTIRSLSILRANGFCPVLLTCTCIWGNPAKSIRRLLKAAQKRLWQEVFAQWPACRTQFRWMIVRQWLHLSRPGRGSVIAGFILWARSAKAERERPLLNSAKWEQQALLQSLMMDVLSVTVS